MALSGQYHVTIGDSLALKTVGANIVAFITLIVLFFWTATSSIFDMEAKDDKDDRWWDTDLMFEESSTLKVVLNLLFLVIACGTLFVPIVRVWSPSKGVHNRFNLGVLAASCFMFANMLFVSFWYSVNFGQEQEEEEENRMLKDSNKNNYDDAYVSEEEMNEKELLVHHRKVVCIMSFLLALVFSFLSHLIYKGGKALPETGHSMNKGDTQAIALKGSAHMELIGELWKLLSLCTITILAALYIMACVLSRGEEAEKMREEGQFFNLIALLMWMLVVTTMSLIVGHKILGEKKLDGTLGVGLLSGGSMYFALMLFMVCFLYANPAFKEHKKDEDGIGPAIATSFACFFLSLLYLVFSLGTYKYQESIIGAISIDREILLDPSEETDESDTAMDGEPQVVDTAVHLYYDTTTGAFKRIEDEAEVDDDTPGDFERMDDEPAMDDSTPGDFRQIEDEPKKGEELFMV